jgi:hypothetical protein
VQQDRRQPGAGADDLELLGDRVGQVRFDRKAVARVGDRRRGNGGERQGAVTPQNGLEPRHLTRNGDREPAEDAQLGIGFAVAHEHGAGRSGRRRFAVVEGDDAARRTVEDQHEAAAADAARGRVDHPDGQRRGDRGVDRVAALPQDPNPRFGGQPVLGRDHAVAPAGGEGGDAPEQEQGDGSGAHREPPCSKRVVPAQADAWDGEQPGGGAGSRPMTTARSAATIMAALAFRVPHPCATVARRGDAHTSCSRAGG